jgi:molybdate transport system substrate-binding protein
MTLTRLSLVTLFLLAGAGPARAAPAKDGELVVFAAASLRESFEALGAAFEKTHPGTKVRLNLAGSQELRTQLEQGAAADVFAAADAKNMSTLAREGLVEAPMVFARNEPVIVVPRGNPAGIHAFADLGKTRRLVIGAPEVPIGGYTLAIFDAAGRKHGPALRARLEAAVVSRELNVRQVLAKVTLGEADAGIVYRTDALAAKDRAEIVAIPAELNVQAAYPVAVVSASKQPALAQAWVQLLLSPEGQARLVGAGFLPAAPVARPAVPVGPADLKPAVPAR